MAVQRQGRVFLVGAGPGDPGLISLRAVECLRMADLVLYDGLVNPLLLRFAAGVCERAGRTRVDGKPIVPQHEINSRMIREAQEGKVVVRLKGGDPCIFGRGTEEADALLDAGIPFEIVPGITAAVAAAEYAGFSLTNRDLSSAVAFVTGHEDPGRNQQRLDFAALAAFPGTLVFYMGLGRLAEICRQLIDAGKPSDTPAAIICQASLPSQKVVSGTLCNLPDKVASAGLHPPSLIVVGDCVKLRKHQSWYECLPLFGVSVGITRPADQCFPIADQIVRLGGEPVLMPLIMIRDLPEDDARTLQSRLNQLGDYQWLIFTSRNGVTHFFRHLREAKLDARALSGARLAAIGTSTADALSDYCLTADLVPAQFRAESLASELSPHVKGLKCLWLKATRGRDVLPGMLRQAGAVVDELPVYQNTDVTTFDESIVRRLIDGRLTWIGLSSPSIARQLAKLLTRHDIPLHSVTAKLASISPVTTTAAAEAGLRIDAEATVHTWDGILDCICEFGSRH
jgi:uroporphyrinogen III methyltransferase / synthase